MIRRLRQIWRHLFADHPDGTRHTWVSKRSGDHIWYECSECPAKTETTDWPFL